MQSTVDKYGGKIQDGSIDPTRDVNKLKSGLIFDPADPDVPVDVLGFGIFRLSGETESAETGGREYVFCPMEGAFSVKIGGESFELARSGGPFEGPAGESSASALYVPKESEFAITGEGDIIYYTAPSTKKMQPVHVKPGEKPSLSRGDLAWRRDVITLVEPGISANLTIGETYSPPALWSGTPPHIHDIGNEDAGESEHEEVYFHMSRMRDREVPNYPVQLLFDGKTMNRAFLCPDRTAVAIPGGCHPVVASPVSDCLYSFGLAGTEGFLGMRDLKDFRYLKEAGAFVLKLREENGGLHTFAVPRNRIAAFAADHGLNELQLKVVELILREQGISVE